jgi:hypothetical protein
MAKVPVNVMMESRVKDELAAHAMSQGRNLSELVRWIVDAWLIEQRAKEPA